MKKVVTIDRLGARGDGVAETTDGELFVPFSLPGEVVSAEFGGSRGRLLEIGQPSAERTEPACPHFGACGGCALQHFRMDAYRAWKRDLVVRALASRGIEMKVQPLVPCEPGTRRRAAFAVRRTRSGVVLGFNRAHSGEIVAVELCPVLVPAIAGQLDRLRGIAELISTTAAPFQLVVTATATGLDVAAVGCGRLDGTKRLAAVQFALEQGFARLSADGETLIEPRRPTVSFDGIAVSPPPGGFLQATEAAEKAMATLVMRHLGGARRVADLFCGCGTFALRLARAAEVHAVEAEREALTALEKAAKTPGLKRVATERRDLFRRPLSAKELERFDGLVFDPPRAGAEDQAHQIARAGIARVAAVSCSPGTLARDLRILVDGGYRIASVTPIDQFLWSPHVEIVALLDRAR